MSFATDIAGTDALAVATFGEAVTYKAAGTGAGSSIKGIYDESYIFVDQLSEGGVQTTSPGIMVKASDVNGVNPRNSTITRGATTYYVRGVEPSGELVVLRLSEDATT
jgi:hypothetical protein